MSWYIDPSLEYGLLDTPPTGPPESTNLEQVATYKQCQRAYEPNVRRRCTFKYLLTLWVQHKPFTPAPTPPPEIQAIAQASTEDLSEQSVFYVPRNRPQFVPNNCIHFTARSPGFDWWDREVHLTDPIQPPAYYRDIFDNRDLIILIRNSNKEVIWFGYLPRDRFPPRFHSSRFANYILRRWLQHPDPNAKKHIIDTTQPVYGWKRRRISS